MSDLRREEPFVREVRRQAARRFGFWQGLSLAGAIGWMTSLPAIVGAFLGRWLDAKCASGIAWTLGLLSLGLAVGCASAWRHVEKERNG